MKALNCPEIRGGFYPLRTKGLKDKGPPKVESSNLQRRYPAEMREPAVRMVHEATRVGSESLRNWVKRADIDSGKRPGATTA